MRILWGSGIILALLASGTTAATQPTALAPAPVAARLGAVTVTLDAHSARVLSAREGTVLPARNIALGGIRAVYRRPNAHFGGSFQHRVSTQQDDLAYGDASISFAVGPLAAEGGIGWRRGYDRNSGLMHGDFHRLVRLGGLWRAEHVAVPIGFETRVGLFLPLGGDRADGNALSGWDGETTIRLALGTTPFDLVGGFRFERLRVNRAEQEVSMLRVGLNWRPRVSQ